MLRQGIKRFIKTLNRFVMRALPGLRKKDMSLQEIADFLGHRDCLTVGVYAKHDLDALRRVAAVDLCGGLRTFGRQFVRHAEWKRFADARLSRASKFLWGFCGSAATLTFNRPRGQHFL